MRASLPSGKVGKIVVRVRDFEPQHCLRMPKFLKPLILVIAAMAFAGGVLGVGKAEARSGSACSKALIHDWYVDGRVDKTYPVHCYREALKDIPEDQLIYGTLRDDLNRALQATIRKHNGKVGPNTLVPGWNDKNGGGLPPGGGNNGGKGGGLFGWLADKLGPSTADTIPIPLLVLGGLALTLILAAAVSFFARRMQARRAATDPQPPRPNF
jgi:hypothetical protein